MPFFPRRAKRTRTRKARKAKASRIPRTMRSGYTGTNKTYNYLFRPGSQFLSNYGVAAANAVQVSPTTLTGPLQLTNTFIKAATSLIPNYSDVGIALPFSMLDIGNYTVFSSIYDQYKLNWVKVKITYLSNAASINGVGITPEISYAVDNDSIVIPNTVNNVRGKQGSVSFSIGNNSTTSRTITIKPKLAVPVNSGATKVNVQTNGWVDCQTQASQYYGLIMWINNMYLPAPGSQNTAIQFDYTYSVSFRGAQNLF